MIAHFDGTEWAIMTTATSSPVQNFWGCESGRILGASQFGSDALVVYDGSAWHAGLTLQSNTTGLSDVWVDPECNTIFAVGGFGRILKGTWQ
jgi:hypothetical protein